MLLGNCINGISLALNSLFTSLVECSREVELLLSFGANERESASHLVREAVRNGTIPQLNSMAIIGLISIPGMMTGQILGGTSVMQASRYQILIVYFIATCSFGTIITELQLALRVCFDSKSILQTDLLKKREKKPNFIVTIFSYFKGLFQIFILNQSASLQRSSSFTLDTNESTYLAPSGASSVMTTRHEEKRKTEIAIISVENLSYGFKVGNDEEGEQFVKGHENESNIRILFENLSLKIYL